MEDQTTQHAWEGHTPQAEDAVGRLPGLHPSCCCCRPASGLAVSAGGTPRSHVSSALVSHERGGASSSRHLCAILRELYRPSTQTERERRSSMYVAHLPVAPMGRKLHPGPVIANIGQSDRSCRCTGRCTACMGTRSSKRRFRNVLKHHKSVRVGSEASSAAPASRCVNSRRISVAFRTNAILAESILRNSIMRIAHTEKDLVRSQQAL